MATLAHTHSFRRMTNATGKDKQRYRCTDPKCTHTVPNRSYLMGKQAQCPQCLKAFIIDNDVLRRVVLRCQVCIGSRDAETTMDQMQSIQEALQKTLLDTGITDLERMHNDDVG